MSRFDDHGLRRFTARDAVFAVLLTTLLVVLAAGSSIRDAGNRMDPGIGRTLVLAAGKPAGWLADRLPVADAVSSATAWLSPDDALDDGAGFALRAAGAGAAGTPPVSPDAFRPEDLGAPPPQPRPLRTLLVTGDSMSTPLDNHLAKALAGGDVRVLARSTPRHRHLEDVRGRLGEALGPAGQDRPAGRRRRLHRSQRGLPDAGRRRRRGRVLRRGLGRALRHPRPHRHGHLPAGRPCPRVLDHASGSLATTTGRASAASSTPRSMWPHRRHAPMSA